jgi:hypothetical protein
MNIIRGNQRHLVPDSYTVLELDTFETAAGTRETAYCVIENIPLQDFPVLDAYVRVHHDLMEAYRDQDWQYCESAITGLVGRWNGELDSFYQDLQERVSVLKQQEPVPHWDGARIIA